jgi:uncharacterized caspase-like protein
VRDELRKVPGRVVLLIDACHSGAVGGERGRSAVSDRWMRDLTSNESGLTVLAACLQDEEALENDRGGYFTRAVIEALAGNGDLNGDGWVYLDELNVYVTRKVKELSAGRQHVRTFAPQERLPALPLARTGP